MKKQSLYFFTVFLLSIIYSCSNPESRLEKYMVNVSEFKVDTSVLHDGDYVEVLGCSGNLTREDKHDFYALVHVRNLETGEKVNVLVTSFFAADQNNPRTRFLSNTSDVGKVMERALRSEADDLEKENIKTVKPKKFQKVFYDTEYIQVDVRKYPTVIGTLGDYTEGNGKL